MGHLVGKDLYRKLGKKIDGLTARTPWNETFYTILKELYSTQEAELVVKMPYGLSTLDQIQKVSNLHRSDIEKLLESLTEKGLVLDLWIRDKYYYTVSPLIIGIFEFTLMRTRGQLNTKEWSRLFHEYLQDGSTYYKANWGKGQTISSLRTIPHEETINDDSFVEILDYEKASTIIESAKKYAIGICSCRHEKFHVGEKNCDIPLETCTSFDGAADTLIKHGMAREVSKGEMLDNLTQSKESGLVLCADNVKSNVSFICNCCGCCCNVLLGISRFGYPNVVVSSNYIARINTDDCIQCDSCIEDCPVNAITNGGNGDAPVIDESICLGCGVCSLNCKSESLKLEKRNSRVFCPEDTFERVILQSLEQGTLQNLIFSNPQNLSHSFLRGVVGGFLKLPVIKASLMSDRLRSRFLTTLKNS
jgi:Pyruvate/2-oxoacid:ferredoxin oxidoreductase delta subunit